MSDFLGNGGDGYTMFAKYDVFNESLMTDTDALAFYIKNGLNGSIPKEYKDFQGRINIVNASASTTVPSSTVPISTIPISTVPNNTSDFIRYDSKKKSGGLSTGGIIAIIIPLAVVLIAVTIIALLCSNKNPSNPIPKIESTISINK